MREKLNKNDKSKQEELKNMVNSIFDLEEIILLNSYIFEANKIREQNHIYRFSQYIENNRISLKIEDIEDQVKKIEKYYLSKNSSAINKLTPMIIINYCISVENFFKEILEINEDKRSNWSSLINAIDKKYGKYLKIKNTFFLKQIKILRSISNFLKHSNRNYSNFFSPECLAKLVKVNMDLRKEMINLLDELEKGGEIKIINLKETKEAILKTIEFEKNNNCMNIIYLLNNLNVFLLLTWVNKVFHFEPDGVKLQYNKENFYDNICFPDEVISQKSDPDFFSEQELWEKFK